MRAILQTAVDLLRDSLEEHADLGLAPEERVPPNALAVELRLRDDRRTHRVTLRSWDDERSPRAQGITIWVLKRAPLSLLDQLRRERRHFIDVGRGVVRLTVPGLVVDRTDLRPLAAAPAAPVLRDPFGDRASLVTRALVDDPGRVWTTRALAEHVGVSTMTASHVVRQLEELGALEVHREGRANRIRLGSLSALVHRWQARYDWRKNGSLSVDAPAGDPARLLRRIKRALPRTRWALTLQAGASLVAPHAAWDKVHVYVDVPDEAGLRATAESAGWAPGPGKLVLLRPWYRQSVWYGMRAIEELPVVSELQLVLDLWNYPVRGYEQAEHLLALMVRRTQRNGAAARTTTDA